ncbi:MAG: DUF433 domain-containing protein [Blastocatellia bacterium]
MSFPQSHCLVSPEAPILSVKAERKESPMSIAKISDKQIRAVYGGDPREIPLYTLQQAASYLKIPFETLRSWVKGRYYPVTEAEGRRFFKPIIALPTPSVPRLSFMNLVEAHVLDGIRRVEQVPFYKVRRAIEYLNKGLGSKHPLADHRFQTDGVDLFIDHLGQLISVSQAGQMVIREVVEKYLRRIERDINNIPIRLYPFLRVPPQPEEPRSVLIDPLVSFGQPVLAKTGVPTSMIAERFYAGDSTQNLARDYGSTREEIEEAVRYEALTRKAA